MNDGIERLKSIKSFPSLVKYLRDELDWPVESDDFEDLTYDYEADELGIDAKTAAKIKEIKQLRPLASNQPWGIFFINFEPKRLPIVALRRILRSLVIKKRASANQSQQAVWRLHDLFFVSSYGEASERQITFAHFSEGSVTGDLPTLNVLGWNAQNTMLRLEDTHRTLKEKLLWPSDETDVESWRKSWSSAFTLTYRYSIRTSKELSIELAKLATVIRARVNEVLAIESERGQVRQLYKAFQEALIHDLSEDDFADMYAQTIAYGLLSARVSRESGALVAENVADMVPVTNPFLKELMQTFLTIGGRRNRIDFDELGINEVVELLRQANMESVLKDFGDRNPNEDPVIHFYELFLKQYDPQKRLKRGVFYTPKPVVSFIVRSVDEILRTEFGLEDGLADTTTWGEMQKRHEGLQIPRGVSEDAPFVQILDPATGTGTFLVEVIDVIHRTMVEKWRRDGKNERDVRELWNDYVPRHLLTRLHGFELMMAPYAIAHMKIGLKLAETKYAFLSSERARIYLTNTLEEPKDFSDYFEQMAPALAHEANAANKIKRDAPITVVIGNPPYANYGMMNKGDWILRILDDYKKDLKERKINLDDDYIKFIRFSHWCIENTKCGLVGVITNNSFLDGLTHRRMRNCLASIFDDIKILNLHGSSVRKETCPDGSEDENVFAIKQGVSISILSKSFFSTGCQEVIYADLWGTQEVKYKMLLDRRFGGFRASSLDPSHPNWFFIPWHSVGEDEYLSMYSLRRIMPEQNTGIQTKRDNLTIHFNKDELREALNDLLSLNPSDLKKKYDLPEDGRDWRIAWAKADVAQAKNTDSRLAKILYRPFDVRYTFFSGKTKGFLAYPRRETMLHFLRRNLGLVTLRINGIGEEFVALCCSTLVEKGSLPRGNYSVFPLYLYEDGEKQQRLGLQLNRAVNLNESFTDLLCGKLNLHFSSDERGDLHQTLGPEDIFHYIYAILHSPTYRTRYAEFLKIDFPRIPLTSDVELFRELCAKGADLVALHLLEDDYEAASWNASKPDRANPLSAFGTKIAGGGTNEVAKGHPKYQNSSVYINPNRWFEGVPEEVWNFHIGGYQVCAKWLKDRRGRSLSEEDITHYQRVVVALRETIRLMAEIDEVIEAHGGWPLAGSQDAPKIEEGKPPLPFA
jgi:predicted helicase